MSAMAAEGDIIAGRYLLGEQIGAGRQGTVYASVDRESGAQVAVKILTDVIAAPNEAAAMASVNHPNAVRLLDHGVGDDTAWLVQDLVEGGRSLADLPRASSLTQPGRAMEPAEAMGIVAQVALGLAALHDAGWVHCNVTARNVLTGADGVVKLCDFGSAMRAGKAMVVEADGPIARPRHLPPEAVRPGVPVAPSIDIYSLGALLFVLLTGSPIGGWSGVDALTHWKAQLPPAVYDFVKRATAADVRLRPASALAVVQELAHIRRGRPRVFDHDSLKDSAPVLLPELLPQAACEALRKLCASPKAPWKVGLRGDARLQYMLYETLDKQTDWLEAIADIATTQVGVPWNAAQFSVLRYAAGADHPWHIDRNPKARPETGSLTASFSLLLTEPGRDFTGGAFVTDHGAPELHAGDAVAFNSATRHAVEPVLSGERLVIVCFAHFLPEGAAA